LWLGVEVEVVVVMVAEVVLEVSAQERVLL
jgi:hypothetical protein